MTSEAAVMNRQADRTIRAIFEHAARIGREQEIDELVRLNADFARDLIQADRCSLWLIDAAKNELWTKIAHGVPQLHISLGEGLIGACVRDNQVLLVNNAAQDSRLLRSVDNASGYRTEQVLCVPLHAEGRVIGALQLLNKPAGFTETDVDLLGLLGHFAASAIESERLRKEAEGARLMKRELDLAREVQARMFPDRPTGLDRLGCVGFCRPARSIGGDYYDLIPLPDGQFALTLGDVAGKGIPAAVMMASIQSLLRTLLKQDANHLAAMLAALNYTVYETSTPERYSTLLCGVISSDRQRFSYVNAGHIPPFLIHTDGRLERLPAADCPVALLPSMSYNQSTAALEPGDTLVIVSDGVVEARNRAGDFWEEEEIERVLLANCGVPVDQLPGLLCAAADNFAAGAEQYDDMTVVAVRVG
ncbi:MAG: PP2C family protein-serine/threonine phosphatase [Terracidiphilus sp.]|jgi:sigma-B regulation protein RsbU (phosphoserine phosphatase)